MSEEFKTAEIQKENNEVKETVKKPKTAKKVIEEPVFNEAQIIREEMNTKAMLKKEPKVRIKIPKNENYKVVNVVYNGVRFDFPTGENIEVPTTIADLLEEAKYI